MVAEGKGPMRVRIAGRFITGMRCDALGDSNPPFWQPSRNAQLGSRVTRSHHAITVSPSRRTSGMDGSASAQAECNPLRDRPKTHR